jgi:hypothetical protein
MPNQKCPVCADRKPKRSCPALGQTICTVCCATKRLVEIRCPTDCIYLSSARSHPAAVVQRRQERDLGFLLPLASDLTETQYRLVVLFQSIIVKHSETAIPALDDADVAEAAGTLASTLETARKGIIYEHQAGSIPAQRLSTELRRIVDDLIRQNSTQQSRVERDTAAALRRIEQGAKTAGAAMTGDEAPVYLKLLTRVLGGAAAGEPNAPEQKSGLIIQP